MKIYLESLIIISIVTTIRISESLFCSHGERFSFCGNNECRPTCKLPQGPMFCDPKCRPGCICTRSLVRRERDGKCVTLEECSAYSSTESPESNGKSPDERPYPPAEPPDERPYPPREPRDERPYPPREYLNERPYPLGRPAYEQPYPPGRLPPERPHPPYLPEEYPDKKFTKDPYDKDYSFHDISYVNRRLPKESRYKELPKENPCTPRPGGGSYFPRQGRRRKGSCRRFSERNPLKFSKIPYKYPGIKGKGRRYRGKLLSVRINHPDQKIIGACSPGRHPQCPPFSFQG